MTHATAIHIAGLIHDAARRHWEAVVEFFAPGLPQPLRIPVRVVADQRVEHDRLTRHLLSEAQRRGIGRF